MKKRILFVDDQPNVLAALRRMLHGQRDEWEMEFAEGGRAALERLDQSPFDVVVTDMRMPGMDGAQLLTEVMNRHPHTVRIILSGQSDQEGILRSVGPTHQYLSKPCDAETLKSTIARACALRDQIVAAPIKGLVSKITSLPSLPSIYQQLVEELQSQDATPQRVGELISSDVGMTTKVLQLVNSSFFGLPRRVTNPGQAVALLGLNLIKPLVLNVGIFRQFDPQRLGGLSLERLQDHSLAVATAARRVAKSQGADTNGLDDAMLAGMVHDLGKLVLADSLQDDYGAIIEVANATGTQLSRLEEERIGTSHGPVGAYLLNLWGLPDPIVEAVAFHHRPSVCPVRTFCPLAAVHIADALSHDADHQDTEARLDERYLAELQLNRGIEQLRDLCQPAEDALPQTATRAESAAKS